MKLLKQKLLGPTEHHPFEPFVPKGARSMIIGTFPIGKFTNPIRKSEIQECEINFNYGGKSNLLWWLLSQSFNTDLKNEIQIKKFLERKKIAIADVIKSCRRLNGSAADSDLRVEVWNKKLAHIIYENSIDQLLFTSEKTYEWYKMYCKSNSSTTDIILLSPSANGARAIGRLDEYKSFHKKGLGNTKDFTLMKYKEIFNEKNFPDL